MQELTLAYHEYLYNQNEKRIAEQKKQHCYYVGNEDKILSYLNKALEKTYAPEDIEEMQLNYVNLTKKVINQMAVVYNEPADRYFISDNPIPDKKDAEGNIIETEKPEDALTDLYWEILPDNISTLDKKAHRYGKLSNVSLTLILIDKEKKKIKYIIEPIYKYTIEFDDEDTHKIVRLTYDKYYKDKNGEDEIFTVVWTNEEHYLMDSLGNKRWFKDNAEMKNPYGKIPLACINFMNGESWHGEGQNDLINVNEQLNVLLTKMVSNDVIYGSEGTDVAVNLGLSKKGEVGQSGVRKVRRGRKHPIVVEQARDDMQYPSLTHVTPTVLITEIREFIDWYIKYIASLKGLNPSAVLAQLKDTSDYQKIMDAVDQMEMRKDDLEFIRIYEKERYEMTKLVWNTHAEELQMEKITDDGFQFKVDLAEIEIHQTPADIQAKREFELKYNISTPVDWLIEDNPDLSKEEAQKILEENRVFNSTNNKSLGRFELLTNQSSTSGQTT